MLGSLTVAGVSPVGFLLGGPTVGTSFGGSGAGDPGRLASGRGDVRHHR